MTINDKSSEVIAAILLGCAGVFMVFGMPFFVGGIRMEALPMRSAGAVNEEYLGMGRDPVSQVKNKPD